MERELGAELSAAISLVNHHFVDNPDWSHPTARIVRLHLWSALHDRPTCWACDPRHWPDPVRPRSLPSQPTMSRRLRSREFEDFMRQLEQRLSHLPNAAVLFKRLDSKPLTVPAHSTDPHARSRPRRGTEIQGLPIARHRLRPSHPHQRRVAPMDACEPRIAARMARRLDDAGHVAADKAYDTNALFDTLARHRHQLIAPRPPGAAGEATRAWATADTAPIACGARTCSRATPPGSAAWAWPAGGNAPRSNATSPT